MTGCQSMTNCSADQLHAPTVSAPATSSSMLPPAALAIDHHGSDQDMKVDPYCAKTSDLLSGLGALTPAWPEEAEVEKPWPHFLPLSSVQPQLRSRVWPPGWEGYWEPLTHATGHLTLHGLGLRELSLIRDPVAVLHPSTAAPEWETFRAE